MKRALALVERDMRKFRRSPALLFASLVLPLVQLVILGNAFGGNIKNVNLGVVNLDRGPKSVDVIERVRAVAANAVPGILTVQPCAGHAVLVQLR